MPTVYATGTTTAKQVLALTKGPSYGASGFESLRNLRLIEDATTVAVGTLTGTVHSVRIGKLPAGCAIVPGLTWLTTDHGSDVAGTLVLVPTDGVGDNITIAGVTVETNTAAIAAIIATNAIAEVTKDYWIEFVPTSDWVVSSTAKTLRSRIGVSSRH
jgi:hypothetical protein